MLFSERVQKYEYKLNDTDDQIVEYIMQNKNDVTTISIQALASLLYTVPNTITRLSKKLGYDGYSQLKNSLKEEINKTVNTQEDSFYFTINKTISLIDMEIISIVAKMLQRARRIIFFGVGDTAPFCELMVKNTRIVGKQADYYVHRHEILYGINQLEKQDVVFFLSLSGETKEVLEMAQLGKEREVQTISLTHFNRNSLQQITDVNLYCYSPRKNVNGYNVTDKTPMMIILQRLSEYFWEISE
ncbi:RpiR family transcriptional regulator [Bacillus sp. SA1-12]|uniref:MurR/RpiR family transcriptional regulator n=1 Tax=Bacillus sp. SA1-12 TaxID=1455638 RepID=UPI000626DEED|nr:MurR/RpiR family transcriptional regulator [Bacillus sp. SA1-12]KKI94026.1 RpiR family transcriptional regulator [Bacillus sp. SA1-12]